MVLKKGVHRERQTDKKKDNASEEKGLRRSRHMEWGGGFWIWLNVGFSCVVPTKRGRERFSISTFLKALLSPTPVFYLLYFTVHCNQNSSVECWNYDTILHRAIQYKLLPSEKFARTVSWCQVHSHIASHKTNTLPRHKKAPENKIKYK